LAVVIVALPAPAKCALAGVGCARPQAKAVLPLPAVVANPMQPKTAEAPKLSATGTTSNHVANYKESGSRGAPVVCEIYSDYECPSCAVFYTTVFPRFVAEYVKTGRVRVVHRDFPLPQHPFARLAARYANAAGELGIYDEVVQQLFASQPEWASNGNVEAAVARVLPAETMRKVQALVKSDPVLDATVADDLSMVARDQINQTPTIVFVYKGIRRKVAGAPSFDLLRSYLEETLTSRQP
jgi:protein-disulfide isomerase